MGVLGPMGPAGFRRRGRRRGLVVGAAVGAAAAKRAAGNKQAADEDSPAGSNTESELEELAALKSKNLITDEEYDAKRKQILGL